MEVEKRKRSEGDGEADGKKAKVEAGQTHGGGDTNPAAAALNCGGHRRDDDSSDADGEVEEFYAILRRIHVAVKYFEKTNSRNGNGKKERSTARVKAKVAAMPWSPNFEREDFEGGTAKGVKGEETVGDNVGLDLNVEPDPASE